MIGFAGRLVDSNAGTGIGSRVAASTAGSFGGFGGLVLLNFLENETGLGTGIFSILVFDTTLLAGVVVTMIGVVLSTSAGRVVTRVTTLLPETAGRTGCLTAGKFSLSSSSESSLVDAVEVVVTIRGARVTLVLVAGTLVGALTPLGPCVTRGCG